MYIRMYVCLTCEPVIPTVLHAYVGVPIYGTAYVRRYEVCMYCVCNIAYIRMYCMYVWTPTLTFLSPALCSVGSRERPSYFFVVKREGGGEGGTQ